MNIFKILSRGYGNVSETNVSAFLSFLIDPYETHGMGKLFMKEFINKVDKDEKFRDLYSNGELSKEILKNYSIKVIPEYRHDQKRINELNSSNPKRKNKQNRIDILIQFNSIVEKKESYLIGIEIKINENAVQKKNDQLKNYWDFLSEVRKPDGKLYKKIHLIYLTTDDPLPNKEYKKFIDANPSLKNSNKQVFWKSISGIIVKIIEDDSKGEIDPLQLNTKSIIQSFNNFINSDFADDKDNSRKYQVNIGEISIFENKLGQLIRQICYYLIVSKKMAFENINKSFQSSYTLILDEDGYKDFQNNAQNNAQKRPNGIEYKRYFNEDETISFEEKKYYVTNQISITNFTHFLTNLKRNETMDIKFIDMEIGKTIL